MKLFRPGRILGFEIPGRTLGFYLDLVLTRRYICSTSMRKWTPRFAFTFSKPTAKRNLRQYALLERPSISSSLEAMPMEHWYARERRLAQQQHAKPIGDSTFPAPLACESNRSTPRSRVAGLTASIIGPRGAHGRPTTSFQSSQMRGSILHKAMPQPTSHDFLARSGGVTLGFAGHVPHAQTTIGSRDKGGKHGPRPTDAWRHEPDPPDGLTLPLPSAPFTGSTARAAGATRKGDDDGRGGDQDGSTFGTSSTTAVKVAREAFVDSQVRASRDDAAAVGASAGETNADLAIWRHTKPYVQPASMRPRQSLQARTVSEEEESLLASVGSLVAAGRLQSSVAAHNDWLVHSPAGPPQPTPAYLPADFLECVGGAKVGYTGHVPGRTQDFGYSAIGRTRGAPSSSVGATHGRQNLGQRGHDHGTKLGNAFRVPADASISSLAATSAVGYEGAQPNAKQSLGISYWRGARRGAAAEASVADARAYEA